MTTYTGYIDNSVGPSNIYEVPMLEGHTYYIELEGAATGGGTLIDPLLGIITYGVDLVDNDGGAGLNSRLVFTPSYSFSYEILVSQVFYYWTNSGTFTLRINEDDYRGTWEGNGAIGSVAVNGTATGTVNYDGDADVFNASLIAGHTYYIDLEGSPTGRGTLLFSNLQLLSPGSDDVITYDNYGGIGANSRIAYTALRTGDFTIKASGVSSSTGSYTVSLHEDDYRNTWEGVGTIGAVAVNGSITGTVNYDGDADVFKASLIAGHTYYIDLEGVSTGAGTLQDAYLRIFNTATDGSLIGVAGLSGVGYNARFVYTPTVTGDYTIMASDYSNQTGTYTLNLHEDDYQADFEGQGRIGNIANSASLAAAVNYAGDADLFGTTLIAGLTYTIEERGSPTGDGSLTDPYLHLVTWGGGAVAEDDDSGTGYNSLINYTPTVSAWYYLHAAAYGATTGGYRVYVSEGRGTDGADTIVGFTNSYSNWAAGQDVINGLGGNDTIRGRGGADMIKGGLGADVLIGGTQADTFRYMSAAESVGTGRDQILAGDSAVAFEGAGAASGDRIDLASIDANTNVTGNQAFIFGGSGRQHLTLTTEGTDTVIHGNTDADAAYEFDLLIADGSVAASAYVAADFIL